MIDRYIMEGDKAVPCDDLYKWGEWLEKNERHIGLDHVGKDVKVSTVFLGLDHGFPWAGLQEADYKPVLWETMIFGGPLNDEQWRYTSIEGAKAGHAKAVRLATLENLWWRRAYHEMRNFWEEHLQPYVEMI